MLTIIYFLIWPFADQGADYEQLAVNYFFETIWKEAYSADYKSIELDNKTGPTPWAWTIRGCQDWSLEDRRTIENGHSNEEVRLEWMPANVRIKRKTKYRHRLKLYVATRIAVGDTWVIQLDVSKYMNFTNHYFIRFDQAGKIIDTCENHEVI